MLRNVLLLAFLGSSAVSAKLSTVYLEDHCGSFFKLLVVDSVTIRLARDGSSANESCRTQVELLAEDKSQLLITFSEFELTQPELSGICLKHFLQIGGLADETQPERLCGHPPLDTLSHYLLTGDEPIEKHFYYSRTVPLQKSHNITISVSTVAFAGANEVCPPLARDVDAGNDFRCVSDNLCIPNRLRCDRVANCRDKSDERDCIGTTTPEPTTTSTTTVASLTPSKTIARDGRASRSSKTPHIVIGTVGGIVILALVAVIAFFLVRRSRRRYQGVTTTVTDGATENVGREEINTALRTPEDSTV